MQMCMRKYKEYFLIKRIKICPNDFLDETNRPSPKYPLSLFQQELWLREVLVTLFMQPLDHCESCSPAANFGLTRGGDTSSKPATAEIEQNLSLS